MDVNIKVPAIEKLLDMVASGIGAVGGPMLARWEARKKADAVRIEARGKADALHLIADAQADARKSLGTGPAALHGNVDIGNEIRARISFQEEKRQSNITSVVGMAAGELKGKEVQNHEVDHDWAARFFEGVQDVSSEQMQQIWSKILAGEVETPGRFSLNTLAILRNMRKNDAEVFVKVAKFVVRDFIFKDAPAKNIPEFPTFGEVLHLESLNLMSTGFGMMSRFEGNHIYYIDDGDVLYVISQNRKDKSAIYSVDIPCYFLSLHGKEIYGIIKHPKNADYLRALASFLNKNGNGILEYASIVSRENKSVQTKSPLMRIEPV